MPSGKSAQPVISDNLDGTVTVQYSPTEAGLHEMHIKYNGTHIPGWYTHTHRHTYIYTHIPGWYTHTHTHVYIHTHPRLVHTHTHTYIYTHTCTHTYI